MIDHLHVHGRLAVLNGAEFGYVESLEQIMVIVVLNSPREMICRRRPDDQMVI